MAIYSITHVQDVYTIENTGGSTIDYEVKLLTSCGGIYTTKYSGSILTGESIVVNLTNQQDGEYFFSINNASFIEIYTKYTTLKKNVIKNTQSLLCNCGCTPDIDCCDGTITLLRTISFYNLSATKYNALFNAMYTSLKCTIKDEVYCSLNKEKFTNNTDVNSLLLKQVALYYLAMYSIDHEEAVEDVDKDGIDTLYRIDSIFPCIRKLGINIEELLEI